MTSQGHCRAIRFGQPRPQPPGWLIEAMYRVSGYFLSCLWASLDQFGRGLFSTQHDPDDHREAEDGSWRYGLLY